jgi:hypothetical protein
MQSLRAGPRGGCPPGKATAALWLYGLLVFRGSMRAVQNRTPAGAALEKNTIFFIQIQMIHHLCKLKLKTGHQTDQK